MLGLVVGVQPPARLFNLGEGSVRPGNGNDKLSPFTHKEGLSSKLRKTEFLNFTKYEKLSKT